MMNRSPGTSLRTRALTAPRRKANRRVTVDSSTVSIPPGSTVSWVPRASPKLAGAVRGAKT